MRRVNSPRFLMDRRRFIRGSLGFVVAGAGALTALPGPSIVRAASLDQLWECQNEECEPYIYDPRKGDEVADIPPGTPFEDLPEDWVCPVCGEPKWIFEPMEAW